MPWYVYGAVTLAAYKLEPRMNWMKAQKMDREQVAAKPPCNNPPLPLPTTPYFPLYRLGYGKRSCARAPPLRDE